MMNWLMPALEVVASICVILLIFIAIITGIVVIKKFIRRIIGLKRDQRELFNKIEELEKRYQRDTTRLWNDAMYQTKMRSTAEYHLSRIMDISTEFENSMKNNPFKDDRYDRYKLMHEKIKDVLSAYHKEIKRIQSSPSK